MTTDSDARAAVVGVRDATIADLDTLVCFNEAMAWETEAKRLDHAVIAEGVRSVLADASRGRYFVAEPIAPDQDPTRNPESPCVNALRVVGQTMITFEWSDWRNGFFWWIQSVYVEPDYRRRGVFRALYEHIRSEAKARSDVCGLRLYVYHTNDRAIATYRHLGMTVADYKLCVEDWSAEPGEMD